MAIDELCRVKADKQMRAILNQRVKEERILHIRLNVFGSREREERVESVAKRFY